MWSGHNYALEAVRQLGIEEATGVVRIGLAHYNTGEEVDATLAAPEGVLKDQGYAPGTRRLKLRQMRKFSFWLEERGLGLPICGYSETC